MGIDVSWGGKSVVVSNWAAAKAINGEGSGFFKNLKTAIGLSCGSLQIKDNDKVKITEALLDSNKIKNCIVDGRKVEVSTSTEMGEMRNQRKECMRMQSAITKNLAIIGKMQEVQQGLSKTVNLLKEVIEDINKVRNSQSKGTFNIQHTELEAKINGFQQNLNEKFAAAQVLQERLNTGNISQNELSKIDQELKSLNNQMEKLSEQLDIVGTQFRGVITAALSMQENCGRLLNLIEKERKKSDMRQTDFPRAEKKITALQSQIEEQLNKLPGCLANLGKESSDQLNREVEGIKTSIQALQQEMEKSITEQNGLVVSLNNIKSGLDLTLLESELFKEAGSTGLDVEQRIHESERIDNLIGKYNQ
ncbi:MAG: hypothetical protein LBS71_03225 [Puniceicoccales bacterium]|jgi:chromosome segregation ATPase|nr:hypothetical protein [Puniceicoccales bacterium]